MVSCIFKKNSSFDYCHSHFTDSNYSNSGLSLFLTQNLNLAKEYGNNLTIIKIDYNQCYIANENEFWCRNAIITEENLDLMGLIINLPGKEMRDNLIKAGYTTLIHNDKEMGNVLVLLDKKDAQIIDSIEIF